MVEQDDLGPTFHIIAAEASTSGGLTLEFLRRGWTARRARGGKMRTVDRMFDEVSAAFQFPSYFGENWPAFDECINDLEWVEWRSGFALIIAESDQVLERDPPDQLRILVDVLRDTVRNWADPERNQWAKPEPINEVAPTVMPFRIVLQVDREKFAGCRERWQAAGARLHNLNTDSWRVSGIFEPRIDAPPGK